MSPDEFKKALKKFCLDNGYEICGTCDAEGIYGEITIREAGYKDDGYVGPEWLKWEKNTFNFR